MMTPSTFFTRLIPIVAVLWTSACSELTLGTPSFSEVYSTLESAGCADCHSPGASGFLAGAQIDLSTQAQAYFTLTTKTVTGTTSIGSCSGVSIVSAGAPERSYLAAVLIPSFQTDDFADVSGCTPLNTHTEEQYLTSSQQSKVEKWIAGGANND